MYKIACSLEWANTKREISQRVRRIGYYPEINLWLTNIENMIIDLNRLEVIARQIKKTYVLEPKLTEINAALEELELHVMALELSI